MIFSKISIGIFLLRIIVERIQVWFIYIALAINVMTGLVFFFVTTLQCQPVSYFWHKEQTGKCIPIGIIIALTYLYSSLNIICDFTFALLPIFIVRKLNMKRRMKVAIIPLLSMGCIASSAVVVRLFYVETFRNPDFLCKYSLLESVYPRFPLTNITQCSCNRRHRHLVYRRRRPGRHSGKPGLHPATIQGHHAPPRSVDRVLLPAIEGVQRWRIGPRRAAATDNRLVEQGAAP